MSDAGARGDGGQRATAVASFIPATLRKRAVQIGLGATALLIATLVVVWQSCGLTDCPDVDGMRGQIASEASVILDQQGQELGKLFVERRVIVELADLPDHVPDAFVAMEDRRFWNHHGVDWLRVLGAGLQNVRELVVVAPGLAVVPDSAVAR